MSKPKGKKKVIVTQSKEKAAKTPATARTRRSAESSAAARPLTFDRNTYILMGAGVVLVLLGMLLMMGGHMPDANTWDEDLIYGTRRTLIAPIVILAGLVVEVYAIFKR